MSALYVKYCPHCGQENSTVASFCDACDADLIHASVETRRAVHEENASNDEVRGHIKTEVATRRVTQAPDEALEIELVANPDVRFSIRSGQSIGRSVRADVVLNGVPDLEYISRSHARFLRRRAQWYVQYIAEGNSITVDGMQSTDDAEIAVYDESIVVLSFTAFRVKLPEISS